MKFLDLARVQDPLRRRRARLRQLPAREVHRVRRPRRRRRRQGRRRLGGGRRGSEHPDRLPLQAALLRAERSARHGPRAHWQERRRLALRVPVGTEILDEDRRDAGRRPDPAGPAGAARARWERRLGERCASRPRQPGPTQRQPGPGGRRAPLWLRLKLIADAGWSGCRTPASRPSLPRSERAAEDRRLPVHDPAPGPRRRRHRRATSSCSPTSPA